MEEFFATVLAILGILILLVCAPFVFVHVRDHWYDPEPIHSGFTPECPTWTEPEDSLPPTFE